MCVGGILQRPENEKLQSAVRESMWIWGTEFKYCGGEEDIFEPLNSSRIFQKDIFD